MKPQNMENEFRDLCAYSWCVLTYPIWSKLIVEGDCLYKTQI